MITLTSHCEAQPKQSRQKCWMAPSRSALLAMTFSALVFSFPANAMSCAEEKTYEQVLDEAEVVFEGRPVSHEFIKINLIDKKRRSNFNQPVLYFMTFTYMADKGWKGIMAGKTASMLGPYPLSKEDMLRVQAMTQASLEKMQKPVIKRSIFALKKSERASSDDVELTEESRKLLETYYDDGVCRNEFEASPENLALLNKKFPQGAVQ